MKKLITGLLFVAYIVAGVIIASANDYFANLDSIESILSAIIAVLLWPLVLLGVDLQIGQGSIDEPSSDGGGGGGGQGGGGQGGGGQGGGGGN